MSAQIHRLFDDVPSPRSDDSAALAAFEECWKAWPRKDGKAIARAKYLAIIKGGYDTRTLDKSSQTFIAMELSATPEQIAAGVKAYVDSQIDRRTFRFKDDGKFIPHLATWLGRAGWEDWL